MSTGKLRLETGRFVGVALDMSPEGRPPWVWLYLHLLPTETGFPDWRPVLAVAASEVPEAPGNITDSGGHRVRMTIYELG